MLCHRESNESGRLFVPWPVEGYGTPIVGTATLAERPEPYNLAVELARGKLNEVRNQLADWRQMGLRLPTELDRVLGESQRAFVKAVISGDDAEVSYAAAQVSLAGVEQAADLLMEAYTGQVLQTRLSATPKLPTLLGCALDWRAEAFALAGRDERRHQLGASRHHLESAGPDRGAVSLGRARRADRSGPGGTNSRSRPARCSSSARAPCQTGSGSGRATTRRFSG